MEASVVELFLHLFRMFVCSAFSCMDAYRYTLYLLQEPVSFTLHCSTAFWLMSLIVDMVGVGVVCKVGVVGVMGDVGVVGVVG